MKKRTKFLLALLSVATMTAGVMGITACKKGGSTGGTSAKSVYEQYVTYTQANGQEPMTYEQWLETITGQLFIKGDQGVPGTPGTPGKPGEDGATIETIDISEDGKYLVITYTDGRTPDKVKLPDTISHVHSYGEDYTVLIPQTDSAHDGLAYKVCKDKNCDHVELVVLKKSYDVTVTMDGKPAKGVPVTINGATTVSDEYGVAKVTDFGELNDYIVSVGEGYMLTPSSAKRTGKSGNNLDITVAKVFDSEGSTLVVEKDGKYGVSIPTGSSYGWKYADPVQFKISGGETEAKKFKITIEDYAGVLNDSNQNGLLDFNGVAELIVKAGETKYFEFTVNPDAEEMQSHKFGEDYLLEVVVEEQEAPAMGAIKETALNVTAGETVDVAGNGDVYYVWNNPNSDICAVQFTLNNATAEFTAYTIADYMYSENPVTVGAEKITLVEGEDPYYAFKPYYIKVTPTGAGASFSFDTEAVYGSALNPKTATLGKNSFGGEDGTVGMSHWFKFTVPAGGKNYILEPVAGGSITYGQSTSGGSSTESEKAVALNEGDYYFNVNSVYTDEGIVCSFKIREFTEADYGMSAEFAKTVTLTENKATAQVAAGESGYMYFKVVASKEGTLRVTPANGNTVYVGATGFNGSMEVTEGQEVILRAAVSTVEYSFEVAVLSDDELAADHTFNVYCNGAPLEGATVTVKVGDEDLTAQTNAEGKATIRFIPGSYSLSVAKDGHFYDRTEPNNATSTSESKSSYTLNLRDDSTEFTFKVTLPGEDEGQEGAAIEGAEISVTTTAGEEVASGTTDANGVLTVDLFILSSGDYNYTVKLPDSVEDYAFTALQTSDFLINQGTAQTINLSPEEKYTFNVTVELPGGTKVEGVKVNVNICEYKFMQDKYAVQSTVGNGTTDADGVAVIKTGKFMIMDEMQLAGVTLENLPKGYTAELETFKANSFAITITLTATGETDPDNPDNPDDPDDKVIKGAAGANGAAAAALAVGENEISNESADGYYMFTAETTGEYKFVVNDQAKNGYIKFLSAGSGKNVGRYTKLIENGNEVDISYNLVLGDIRDVDKAYIFTVTLKKGESVVIGYNTAGAAATAKINVTLTEDESGEPDEPETPVITLEEGDNVIDLSNGPVFVTFNVGESNYTISWEAEDVVLYDVIDGEVDQDSSYDFEEGAGMYAMFGSEFTFLVTATSSTTVTLIVEPALW